MPTSLSPPRCTVILFTRYPEAGRAKTRLIPRLGAEGAAALQRRLTGHALGEALRLQRATPGLAVEVRTEGGDPERLTAWLGEDLCWQPQGTGDLGERLRRALDDRLGRGARAVLVGCDLPGLSAELLRQAVAALSSHDLVLGPAHDGGYYLVGLRNRAPTLFHDIPWGGPTVLERTLERARAASLAVALLAPLADVDRPEDLDSLDPSWLEGLELRHPPRELT
ncbi:MAG: TIGR04282 family arsenosugar biosynthesis glycosyltransferase [Deltaproteobacteria bacterium]|nr:TIGR04282 family arsenosugar biosynthesis glycosyltransferase [Deltaproteobacteria bacterium]